MLKYLKEIIQVSWYVMRNKDINETDTINNELPSDLATNYKTINKEKELATNKNEPWVSIMDMDVDFDDISNGSFELDWNDQFIAKLIRHGYEGKEDADLVDQWFTDICRNIVLETHEQEDADPYKRSNKLENNRREYK